MRGRVATRGSGWPFCALLAAMLACASAAPAVTHRRSGTSTTLDGLRGKVVVVSFWAEWCKPCLLEIPEIARVADGMAPDVIFLPVYYRPDPGTPRFQEWIEAQPEYFRERICFANGSFLQNHRRDVIPQTFVYGRDGGLVKSYSGAILGERVDDLRTTLRNALAR